MLSIPTLNFQPLVATALISLAVLACATLAYVGLLNRVGLNENKRRAATPLLMVWTIFAAVSCAYAGIVLSAPSANDINTVDLKAREQIINTYRVNPETPIFDRTHSFGPQSTGRFQERLEVSSQGEHFIVDLAVENQRVRLHKNGVELERKKD